MNNANQQTHKRYLVK